jgi:hypothetical protein
MVELRAYTGEPELHVLMYDWPIPIECPKILAAIINNASDSRVREMIIANSPEPGTLVVRNTWTFRMIFTEMINRGALEADDRRFGIVVSSTPSTSQGTSACLVAWRICE